MAILVFIIWAEILLLRSFSRLSLITISIPQDRTIKRGCLNFETLCFYCLWVISLILFMPTAIFRLFTAGGQSLVRIGLSRNIVGIITHIRDQGLDILHIRAVCEIGHRSRFLFIIDIHFLDAFFMAEVFLDPFLALLALYRRRFNGNGQLCLLLGHGDTCKA